MQLDGIPREIRIKAGPNMDKYVETSGVPSYDALDKTERDSVLSSLLVMVMGYYLAEDKQ